MQHWTQFREKFILLKEKYKKFFPAAFFVAGFLFDIITLSRIDDALSIIQQLIYLIAITTILRFKTMQDGGVWAPSARVEKFWLFHNEALHFLLGSLLSLYTIFFFVSSSLSTSFVFMFIMFAVLVANELPVFQKQGLMLKYGLFALCLFSFFCYLVPVAMGFIGIAPFLIAILVGLIVIGTQVYNYQKIENLSIDVRKTVVAPALAVSATLILLYAVKLLPPIPLSIQYIGIYHQIERIKVANPQGLEKTEYVLKYERPFWKFWQNGAQTFVAYTNDRVFCFVRIFSPANFQDKVYFHWLKMGAKGWETQDRIPNSISGGRDEGYRGYAMKSNFEPGEWRVQVETEDGREIGRIHFTLEKADGPAPEDRELREDRQ